MAGAGNALSDFTTFVNVTGPTWLTGPDKAVNDAQKTNYRTLGYMLRGQSEDKVLSGGVDIRDYILLSVQRRSRSYLPGENQEYTQSQPGDIVKLEWRHYITDMSWTLEALELNAGGDLSQEAKFHKYKDYYKRIQQEMHTDAMDHAEERFWASPSNALMETSGGKEMHSIGAFIHEHNLTGSAGQVQTAGVPKDADLTDWTTVANINPTATGKTRWQNKVLKYGGGTAANSFAVGNADNVLKFLDKAYLATDFQPPPMLKSEFESAQKQQSPRPFIGCSLDGHSKLTHLYRESKDIWVNMTDPWQNPMYAGAPLVYIAQLDTAALYSDGSALAAESAASITGPRFYGIQPQYLCPVYHKTWYFQTLEVMKDRSEPTTRTLPVLTWCNLFPRSRARHFLLTPETTGA